MTEHDDGGKDDMHRYESGSGGSLFPESFPRLWRSPQSRFNEDEPLQSVDVYTDSTLRQIRDQGFNAIWMRGRLWELIRSKIYPELNDPHAPERVANLRATAALASRHGLGLYLYFNEPLALPESHAFWRAHPGLAGEPHTEEGGRKLAFCTSTDEFRALFTESVCNLYRDLEELAGVILITASEFHTHCWSHKARLRMGDDPAINACVVEMECPRCREREPADVVGELVGVWQSCRERVGREIEIWVWNWSWSMWYRQPQREVIDALPPGVRLMADFERGSSRKQRIGEVFVDEYSLGFVGPSERFLGAREAARSRGLEVCAKLQIGTTHELATVPNLPLIPNLYEKLRRIAELDLAGLMCSWNFGNSPTVNTYAFNLFFAIPRGTAGWTRDRFLEEVIRGYFGVNGPGEPTVALVKQAWEGFCASFAEYPFSNPMLYYSPMNYAPAFPLTFHFQGRPTGPTWIPHAPWGDDIQRCLEPFSIDQVVEAFSLMAARWRDALSTYEQALAGRAAESRHAFEELSCARMIDCHLQAMLCIVEFHRWRSRCMAERGLRPPCELPREPEARRIVARHHAVARRARGLLQEDSRLGFHQEPHAQLFDVQTIDRMLGGETDDRRF